MSMWNPWRDDCWAMIKERQCGTYFVKDGKQYKLQTKDLMKQAKLADIDFDCDK